MTPAEMSEARDLLNRATQRPWAVLECHASRIFYWEIVRNNKNICAIYRSPSTAEYDKNLIVRAPELLEKALDYIAELESHDTIRSQSHQADSGLYVPPSDCGKEIHPTSFDATP